MISGVDYVYQNYTFSFKDGEEEKYLTLIPVDDNIVESDENYTLVIQLPLDHHPRIQEGKIDTTKITIYNDDGKEISICAITNYRNAWVYSSLASYLFVKTTD